MSVINRLRFFASRRSRLSGSSTPVNREGGVIGALPKNAKLEDSSAGSACSCKLTGRLVKTSGFSISKMYTIKNNFEETNTKW